MPVRTTRHFQPRRAAMPQTYDAIIIGAGHNGLVCAAYLARAGQKVLVLQRSPSSFSPFPDGRYLMMGPDHDMTLREIAKFSQKDAENYPKYEAMLTRVADFLEPLLTQTP